MAISAPPQQGRDLTLSNLAPRPAQRWLALGVVVLLVVGFVVAAAPLGTGPLRRIDAFMPAYATAIFFNDLVTAILLLAQVWILRSSALLAMASGYLLTALIAIPWLLTFPGVFAPRGLLGAGLQSTAWLYILWQAGFATSVIAYTRLKALDSARLLSQRRVRTAVMTSIGGVIAVVCGATVLVTAGDALMPPLMADTVRISGLWLYVAGATATLIGLALVFLWSRWRSVLDLWLMVVLCAYLIEIMLITYPVPTRFSFGWYAGRVYGFISSLLVLLVLLKEITMMYGQLLHAVLAQRREREARLLTGEAVSASIAHELKQPLSAITISAGAALRWVDRAPPDLDEAKAALRQIVSDGQRAGTVIDNIRALFKTGARSRALLDVSSLIRDALAFTRGELEAHLITVQADYNKPLPLIKGDAIQLQQVLVNLITNAIEAMAANDGERLLCVRSDASPSGSVMVMVEDTGKGIEPDIADRIFNPLFTTKGHGMGMGLSICRSIIEAHDGGYGRRPTSGGGLRFTSPCRQRRSDRYGSRPDTCLASQTRRGGLLAGHLSRCASCGKLKALDLRPGGLPQPWPRPAVSPRSLPPMWRAIRG
jgi:signal transduction histidine kinase